MHVLLALAALIGGLHGTVTRGPMQPVCMVGQSCTAPAPGVVLVFSRLGRDVARVRTGAGGIYRVVLAPGVYAARLAPPQKIGGFTPRTVRVPQGRFARVDFAIDTGIR